jgi:class 3 adenylate cyclase
MICSDKTIPEEMLHEVDQEGSDEANDSDGDSGHGASSIGTGATSAEGAHPKEIDDPTIARKENAAVLTSRIVVLAVLVLSTSGVAFAVYYYINKTEETEFDSQFVDDSYKVFQALGSVLDLSLGTVDAFVVSMVSYASASNSTWPFVTLPNHAARVAKIRSLSKALIIQQYQIVAEEDRADWEIYANDNKGWVEDVLVTQINDDIFQGWKNVTEYDPTSPGIVYGTGLAQPNSGPYTPSWQGYPLVPTYLGYNWNGIQDPKIGPGIQKVMDDREVIFSETINLPDPNDPLSPAFVNTTNGWAAKYASPDRDTSDPLVRFTYPVLDTAADSVSTKDKSASNVVAIVTLTFFWRDFIEDILPTGGVGLVVVFENTCDQSFTYQINGPEVEYLGPGDLHDTKYTDMAISSSINDLGSFNTGRKVYTGLPLSTEYCTYSFKAYPSYAMESEFRTSDPIIFMVIAVFIFAFTSLVFLVYDKLVAIRQQKVMTSGKSSLSFFVFVIPFHRSTHISFYCSPAVQSNAIVTSLFPSNVRDRLYNQGATAPGSTSAYQPNKARLKMFLNDGETEKKMKNPSKSGHIVQRSGRPIADLFNDTTVLFADIAGFTAWSSVREPSQVFTLLEEIYGAFDAIAARRGVFKVETIGDSYVAVTGLPEPREDHAVVMAKFARDCRTQFSVLSRELEVTLGPETGDLQMRFGLHSGPVTAGVLRGQKSRFQLFGDTVNTAARMESTGTRNRIQVSQSTADLLITARKGSWVKPRKELVEAKGKGKMQTYWVEPSREASKSVSPESADTTPLLSGLDDKTERLVGYNTEVLAKLIHQIVMRRSLSKKSNKFASRKSEVTHTRPTKETMVLDEVKEIIELPGFDVSMVNKKEDPEMANLNPLIFSQLREYVVVIAKKYHQNPFHNFEHASHVCMSVAKLLSRIVAPDQVFSDNHGDTSTYFDLASSLHDHTYGITSDPLTQFACIFAALIHDADHPGVPNTQLVKEDSPVARTYKSKSVAEQNSVDIAWKIYMEPEYAELRAAVCPTEEEKRRFRQLVVNSVMATDIMDKDLKNLRNERWEKAFSDSAVQESERTHVNRKATIVIEHLMQASDVAHTMQHWHIYRKWNERLFEEMYCAYKAGRAEKDPAEFWYQGELGFFDFYIVPLTKKLSECGVFGVSSDEYLNYAMKNREEWERRGREVIASMVERLNCSPTAKKGDAEV